MPKNVQTTVQLCSFHKVAMLCSKSFKLGFKQYVKQELPDVQTGFQRSRGTRDQIANTRWLMGKQGNFRITSPPASSTTLMPLCTSQHIVENS